MDLERTLATRLSPVSRAWRNMADVVLAELRISNSTGWCLVYLDRLGEEARQSDLARALELSQPSLVRPLRQLEASGHVERWTDPDDRRNNYVRLTAAGRTLARQIEDRLQALRADLLDGLPSEDIEAALRVCDVLGQRIAERRQQP